MILGRLRPLLVPAVGLTVLTVVETVTRGWTGFVYCAATLVWFAIGAIAGYDMRGDR